jgi:hypothetical protein
MPHRWYGYFDPWSDAPPWAIENRKMMEQIIRELKTYMAVQQDIKDALDKLTADVAAETTVQQSLLVYVKGLKDQILALANATPDTTTAQALQALATQIEVNAKNDADAMVANTDTPPPVTPPTTDIPVVPPSNP